MKLFKKDETVRLTLQTAGEYTYVELLRAVYHQRSNTLLPVACGWIACDDALLWNQSARIVVAVFQNGALLWPTFREIIADEILHLPHTRRSSIEIPLSEEDLGRAVLKDIDFWML